MSKLASRIRNHFKQEIPLKVLFEKTTIKGQARFLSTENSSVYKPTLKRVHRNKDRKSDFTI